MPFTHDYYVYLNDATDKWTIYNMAVVNTYHGSTVYVGVFFLIDDALLIITLSNKRHWALKLEGFLRICSRDHLSKGRWVQLLIT